MKMVINFIAVLIVFCSYAQDPQLFQYTWRLESIITDTDSFIPNPNPDPNTGTFNHIFFYDQSNGVPYYFQFGVYGSVFGDNLIFSGNQSFVISGITLTSGESSSASGFLVDYFLFEDQLNDIIFNPFNYDFRYENGFIYLDIINSIGSVATFYDNFLNQEDFLKQQLKVYPNPVKDMLSIDCQGIQIENLKIFDLRGRIVYEKDNNISDQISLAGLKSGVYILQINSTAGIIKKKLIKE